MKHLMVSEAEYVKQRRSRAIIPQMILAVKDILRQGFGNRTENAT